MSAQAQLGYDTWSNVYEDHSKTYRYSYYEVPTNGAVISAGRQRCLPYRVQTPTWVQVPTTTTWIRRCVWNAAINYDRTSAEKHNVYGQLKYDYEYNDKTGTNTTVYRHNVSLFAHYGFDSRLSLGCSARRVGFQPYGSWQNMGIALQMFLAAWNISNEAFMKNVKWVDFLKLRASWGNQASGCASW